jgi:signal transduction histidine kinase
MRSALRYRVVVIWSVTLTTVACFTAVAVVARVRGGAVDENAKLIIEGAVPSIENLLRARSELRRVTTQLSRGFAGAPVTTPELEHPIAEIQSELDHYRTIPSFPGEKEIAGRLFSEFDAAILVSLKTLNAQQLGDLETALVLFDDYDRRVSDVDELLHATLNMNVDEVSAFSAVIRETVATVGSVTWILSAITILIALTLVVRASLLLRRQDEMERERERIIEERLRELDLFSARIAHDIMSPLTAASVALQSLKRIGDSNAERVAQRGLSSVGRVQRLVDGLLDFARSGGHPAAGARSAPIEVAKDVIAGLADEAAAANVVVRLEAPERVEDVCASSGVLTSVLANLIRNAIRYMGDRATREIRVRLREVDSVVRIEVEDTGPGIDPELEAQIFEPYFRASKVGDGLGLGLATVRRLTEAHEGSVFVRSRRGIGSTFVVELPRCTRASISVPQTSFDPTNRVHTSTGAFRAS